MKYLTSAKVVNSGPSTSADSATSTFRAGITRKARLRMYSRSDKLSAEAVTRNPDSAKNIGKIL